MKKLPIITFVVLSVALMLLSYTTGKSSDAKTTEQSSDLMQSGIAQFVQTTQKSTVSFSIQKDMVSKNSNDIILPVKAQPR
ncbi:MAG: hypothetical protein BGN88_12265 [Clostridiales bacterium 43-6]|nr:MAG: hypothetical protein BGN88_12265 [Clostridiales bacterium 43-6]